MEHVLSIANLALGILLSLFHDGLKTASITYDRQSATVKQVIYWALVIVAVMLLRGFDLPSSLIGWGWFLLTVVVVGFVGQGFFRWRKSLEVNSALKRGVKHVA